MTAPFPVSRHRRYRDAAVLGGAFVVGVAIGFGVVAHAVGKDVFARLPR